MKKIVLAGGCFWGVEAYFKQIEGVVDTTVGYANGHTENPTYEEVCSGYAAHAEAIKIVYDENVLSLKNLLKHYFHIIDPTALNKQGNDRGIQYRSGIFYEDLATKEIASELILEYQPNYPKPIVVIIEPLKNFYEAEAYHQDYLDKNPNGYCHVNLDDILEVDK